jgi:hypothetical protein
MRDMDDATAAELDEIDAAAVTAADTAAGADDLAADVVLATPDGPLITVVKGAPNDVELAALVAVLTAASAADGSRPAGPIAEENWGHPIFMHQHPTHFSPSTFSLNPQLRR